jgi:cysteinyl-tRNA synthetase
MTITLYNTLARAKVPFVPIDPTNVRMYVCGPTVYDAVHIGNGRPVIVFDLLFRLLRHTYGAEHVTYARNITDVDDKINARAARDFPGLDLNTAIGVLTSTTSRQYREVCEALGALVPTVEPRATAHIPEMIAIIQTLVNKGHAYVAADHVLFDVSSMPDYGLLSGRSLDEMEAGARVDIAAYKDDPMDFVLWKPSKPGEPSWVSPCGITTEGRPGWHIECSAMAGKHLGTTFDIHGGGVDLVFPHHENEVAQSRCAHGTPVMANIWMHNGFLQVEGEKMSKSLGNFITINELLTTETFGKQAWPGKVCRLAMLSTHYRSPIDWTVERLSQARATLMDFADLLHGVTPAAAPNREVVAALSDDLNTASALSILHGIAKSARRGNLEAASELKTSLQLMGVYDDESRHDFAVWTQDSDAIDAVMVDQLVAARLAARKAKDFKEGDRLRDQLVSMGIVLNDAKDVSTGEIVTTWSLSGGTHVPQTNFETGKSG